MSSIETSRSTTPVPRIMVTRPMSYSDSVGHCSAGPSRASFHFQSGRPSLALARTKSFISIASVGTGHVLSSATERYLQGHIFSHPFSFPSRKLGAQSVVRDASRKPTSCRHKVPGLGRAVLILLKFKSYAVHRFSNYEYMPWRGKPPGICFLLAIRRGGKGVSVRPTLTRYF